MTLCRATGKPKLTAAAAAEQVRHSRRAFVARRCPLCGTWHVNSITFIAREQRRRQAAFRQARNTPPPIELEDA